MRPRRGGFDDPPEVGHPNGGRGVTRPDADDLAEVRERLQALKARDLAAKRSGNFSERPALARAIYDLVRALWAQRGG